MAMEPIGEAVRRVYVRAGLILFLRKFAKTFGISLSQALPVMRREPLKIKIDELDADRHHDRGVADRRAP
jgi:hypothetical protein